MSRFKTCAAAQMVVSPPHALGAKRLPSASGGEGSNHTDLKESGKASNHSTFLARNFLGFHAIARPSE
eukprot:3949398-Amphidinium_carterae.1